MVTGVESVKGFGFILHFEVVVYWPLRGRVCLGLDNHKFQM